MIRLTELPDVLKPVGDPSGPATADDPDEIRRRIAALTTATAAASAVECERKADEAPQNEEGM